MPRTPTVRRRNRNDAIRETMLAADISDEFVTHGARDNVVLINITPRNYTSFSAITLQNDVNTLLPWWVIQGFAPLSAEDTRHLDFLTSIGLSEDEAKLRLHRLRAHVRAEVARQGTSQPQTEGTAEAFNHSSSQSGDPRFASIGRYINRASGEDAIAFFERAWADAPRPFYREDVEAHDADLVDAISQRCRNLNRKRAPDERIGIGDILPPNRPRTADAERRRDKSRDRQADYRERHFHHSASPPTKLPDAPPAYPYKPHMEGGIERYLRDNWLPHIRAGILSRPDLKRIDKPAYVALSNRLRGNRHLPSDIHVPDKSEALDMQIAAMPATADPKQLRNAAEAAIRRARAPKPQ